jgi:hypothetical protein
MRPGQLLVWCGFWGAGGPVLAVMTGVWWPGVLGVVLAVLLYRLAGWAQRRADRAELRAIRGGRVRGSRHGSASVAAAPRAAVHARAATAAHG